MQEKPRAVRPPCTSDRAFADAGYSTRPGRVRRRVLDQYERVQMLVLGTSYIYNHSRFHGGRIHAHKLLEGARWLLDRPPLAILWLGSVLQYSYIEAKISNSTLKIYRGT